MYNQQPPSYIPPSAPPRRGPGCWLVGGLTCLGIFVLCLILVIVFFVKVLNTPSGKKVLGSVGSVMHSASMVPECQEKMKNIREAIVRYHEHTGSYPNNLKQLVPTYLPSAADLHCMLDTNTDPSHVTFTYDKPSESTPDSATLILFHMQMTMSLGDQTQTQHYTYSITKGGELLQNMDQSTITPATSSPNVPSPNVPTPPSTP